MTRTLILIRHAKSDWDDPRLTDHQRALNPRGRRAAPRIGAWLAREGLRPEEALVSDATRTRETWHLIADRLRDAPAPRLIPALYHASPDTMLRHLRDASASVVAMVAHNPGTAALARMLAKTPPAHPDFGRYPTAATTVLGFDAEDWRDIAPGTGQVRAFVTPRDLPDPA